MEKQIKTINRLEAEDEAAEITANDRALFHKAHFGIFPALFARDWAILRDKADSQIMKDYFQEKVLKMSQPFAVELKAHLYLSPLGKKLRSEIYPEE